MTYSFKIMSSPVGLLTLIASDSALMAVIWEDDDPKRVRVKSQTEDIKHPVLLEAERQLQEYFSGKRKSFSLKLDLQGTEFQKAVWSELLKIPYGETRSYGELARKIGNAKASRAVGAANGKNPISIIVPCHRVIGSSGKLTGFAGGLLVKEKLLKLEN